LEPPYVKLILLSGATFPARLAAVIALCASGAAAIGLAWADAADAHIGPPGDVRYPGTIQLAVDAGDTAQGTFRVHEAAGRLGGVQSIQMTNTMLSPLSSSR